ncbi:hypothetical protein FB547_11376 [Variovorax beijingensis]|uniref:Uncharacterized protein n=1 Tax=Variovorax beijingensis TaxID=2496117 RepID=A0A561BBB0_9BURK|nr:hypothetical protein FB547_11376 [Variovorax beijingensis]
MGATRSDSVALGAGQVDGGVGDAVGAIGRVARAAVAQRRSVEPLVAGRRVPPALEQRCEEVHALVGRLAEGVERGRALAEVRAVALLEGQVGFGVERGEVAASDVEVLRVVGADAQQLVLADGAGQPEHRARQAGGAEGAVELDRVLPDQRQHDRVRPAPAQRVERLGKVGGAEGHVHLADQLAAGLGDVAARHAVRHVRPHVVVADGEPAPRTLARAEPADRGPELARRRLADGEDARRRLPAFVERGVDERDLPADGPQDALAHGAGVHADDGVDVARLHQLDQRGLDVGRIVRGVDGQEPAAAPANARLAVELPDGQLGRR